MSAGTFQQLATVTTFACQLEKCTSWQNSKTQSSCQMKNTTYLLFMTWWAHIVHYHNTFLLLQSHESDKNYNTRQILKWILSCVLIIIVRSYP